MKVVFLKFHRNGNTIEIPTGCVRFQFRHFEIANDETLFVQMDSKSNLQTSAMDIDCVIFTGDALYGIHTKWSALSIITNESFEQEIKRRLQLVHYSERELVALENTQEVALCH